VLKEYIDKKIESIKSETEKRVNNLISQKNLSEIIKLQKDSPKKEVLTCDIEKVVNEWTRNFEQQITVPLYTNI